MALHILYLFSAISQGFFTCRRKVELACNVLKQQMEENLNAYNGKLTMVICFICFRLVFCWA
jgi:hypothetical protein